MDTKQFININYPLADGTTINITVSIEVAEAITKSNNKEKALKKQDSRHLRYLPLSENECVAEDEDVVVNLLMKETKTEVHSALDKLTETQRRRVYLRFFCNMTFRQIAKMEGVNVRAVADSIEQALLKLKKHFNK